MKNKILKTIALLGFGLGLHENVIAQQNPTNNNPASVLLNGTNSGAFWSRAGNTPFGGNNNIFGTLFNSPIYTQTNGAFREKLNGDFGVPGTPQYPINGYLTGVNTSGYLLLGDNTQTQGFLGPIYQQKGAFSLLHLNGPQNSVTGGGFTQEYGYRPWMKTGITFTGNNDLMYFGIRQLVPGQDQTEMVVSWSDNSNPTGTGPDDFAFRFMGLGAGTTIDPNLNSEDDLDGRHIARFAPTGEFGLGNTFGNPASSAIYVRPQSLLHLSLDQNRQVYMQVTNQNGTGQTAGDGLKVGYAPTNATNLEARINQQENDRLSLYSNNGERIRITQIGALNNGVAFNPGGLAANRTRVAISHDPTTPITRPLSLLHLGYDVQGATNDGWRSWMDIGMFVSNQSDNVYIGLKQEAGTITGFDRQDAVLNWGDNQVSGLPPGNGPDYFRFIFTSTTTPSGAGTPPATGTDGLETARISPIGNWGIGNFYNNPLFPFKDPARRLEILSDKTTAASNGDALFRLTNYQQDPANPMTTGKFSDFSQTQTGDLAIFIKDNTMTNTATQLLKQRFMGINTMVPGNTLEISSQLVSPTAGTGGTGSSGLRFTNLNTSSATVPNPGTGLLTIDANGDVIYVPASASGGVAGAHNGTSLSLITPNYVAFGQDVGQPGNPAALLNNREVPMNNNNIVFTGSGTAGVNRIGIGTVAPTIAKLEVSTSDDFEAGKFTTTKTGSGDNIAVDASASGSSTGNDGGLFTGSGTAPNNTGVEADAMDGTVTNQGGVFSAIGFASGATNYGIFTTATGGNTAYGIYASASGATTNYAGRFEGNVLFNGTLSGSNNILTSDIMFKTNIDSITNAMGIIKQLKPRQYYLDTANTNGFKFPGQKQYGLIAQDVQTVLPELIYSTVKPADYDTAGVLVHPAVTYKALNYNAFIAILMKGMQEQQAKLDSVSNINHHQDSINTYVQNQNTNLQNQINVLSDMINACCASHQALNGTSNATPIHVNLNDGQNIVLNQNTPNPWAEQTVITYFLPDNVSKAQILFYNAQGKLIQATELTQKGAGQLNVFGDDLSNGIYTYTLVVDGKIIETKKMVKQQ
ncbi:MAG: Collagen triple helix repeat-containing protein [Bacteroidetes bacterium]|nr:Collagen triple helix repeat-containing protein [Bacteroidota bacterium]